MWFCSALFFKQRKAGQKIKKMYNENMNIKKIIICTAIILLGVSAVYAQNSSAPERELWVRVYKDKTEISAWETDAGLPLMIHFMTTDVYVRRNGTTDNKREGDGATPIGEFEIRRAFGLLPDPGTELEYTQVQPGDVWVDDSASPFYNRFVGVEEEVERTWNSAENLAAYPVEYKYAFVIEYNTENPTPGAGSAIFFHCENQKPTAGCISVPENDMIWLLQWLRPGDKIIIERVDEAQ